MSYRLPDPVSLKRSRRWTIYAVGLGLWLSGALWLIFHYFEQQKTEFGPAPHPLEHWWLALHGLFGFAALWTFGMLWSSHVVGAWKTKRHRVSGSIVFAVLLILIVTGYLLYYLVGDESLSLVALAHWAIGLALPIPFLWHRLIKNRR